MGIDLGTTNSCVSVWRNNQFEIIPDKYGNFTIPSIVAFSKLSTFVGFTAKNQTQINQGNVFYEIKRLIGTKINDICDMEYFGYTICCDDNNTTLLKSDYGIHTPEELSSLILLELKQMAKLYLGEEVTNVVITVPAYFNDVRRQATKDAATIAGLNVIRIINEPTAAALAYGLGKKDCTVLVYDLGGGTLDISILNINDGIFEVIGSSGNIHLGGTDFDNRLIMYCLEDFKNIEISLLSLQKLKQECEKAKKILSNVLKTNIIVKNFCTIDNKYIDLIKEISRNKFDELCSDLYYDCLNPLDELLKSCNMEINEIDDIILVGGSTRMPKIRENIKNYFKKEPNISVNPDEIVSMGASIMGYILENKNEPFSQSITLLDVTTLSLGIETLDGIMDIIVPRNTTIPTTKKKLYTTTTDYETSVNINVYEGERKLVKDNIQLGSFELSGLEKMPRGYAKISVIFKINSSGIIEISAEDLRDGNSNYIKVTSNKNNLNQDKINELIEKAKKYEEQDNHETTIKTLRYELIDIIKAIKYNLTTSELNENEKNKILMDVNNINIKNEDIDENLLKEHIKTLREKYFGLCSIINNNINYLNSSTDTFNGTYIYNDECELKYDNVQKNVTVTDNNENIKINLINLCISFLDNLSLVKLEKEKEEEIKYILDDIILWAHVQFKIIKEEYEEKINYVNKLYTDIFTNIKNNDILNEIEYLCYELLDDKINENEKINEILEWIIDTKAKLCVNMIDNINTTEYENNINILKNIKEKI